MNTVEITPEIEEYLAFESDDSVEGNAKRAELFSKVQYDVLHKYRKSQRIPKEHKVPDAFTSEHLNEDGRFKIGVVSGGGGFGESSGYVFDISSNELIAVVYRNYNRFWFQFIDDHPNGHKYLVCGEDYQGITVIELDTRERIDYLHENAVKLGSGFCVVSAKFDPKNQILLCNGCYWACPYEIKFFDFMDPMSRTVDKSYFMTLPELTYEGHYVDTPISTESTENGIKVSLRGWEDPCDDEDDDGNQIVPIPKEIYVFKPIGDYPNRTLSLVSHWIDDNEKDMREKREASRIEYEKKWEEFKKNDPLYLEFIKLCEDFSSKDDYVSTGVTHDNWCPDFKIQEKRICKRIVRQVKNTDKITIGFEWGAVTGPIKVEYWIDGKSSCSKFWMEHSVDSIRKAMAFAKEMEEKYNPKS